MASTGVLGSDCFKYNFALVSRIANTFAESSSFPLKDDNLKINVEKARKEHEDLVEALRRIGLDVIELPSDDKHPDGLFVGDIAVVIHGTALICNPPTFKDKPTRQGEVRTMIIHLFARYSKYSRLVYFINELEYMHLCIHYTSGTNWEHLSAFITPRKHSTILLRTVACFRFTFPSIMHT